MIASLRPAREKKSQYVVGSKSLKRPWRGEHQAQSCKVKSTQRLRLAWHNGSKPIFLPIQDIVKNLIDILDATKTMNLHIRVVKLIFNNKLI